MENSRTMKLLTNYLYISGVVAHVGAFSFLVYMFYLVWSSGFSLPVYAEKVNQKVVVDHPSISKYVTPLLTYISSWKEPINYRFTVEPLSWRGVGADTRLLQDRLLSSTIKAYDVPSLLESLKKAKAGQTIELLPGVYQIDASRIMVGSAGTEQLPIVVMSRKLGDVTLRVKGEGFLVNQPFWQFHNLHVSGTCEQHDDCEHAFHVVGKAKGFKLTNSILKDFNAAIKVNGLRGDYPDGGQVIGNTIYNETLRYTGSPVTPIDLMHAHNWKVSNNFIFDFIKGRGNLVSYGAFFKGGSIGGEFSRNLVMCNANLSSNHVAIGLSLGGGGSPEAVRRNGARFEHKDGVIKNNIIMHCAQDVGIYINRSMGEVINNTLYNTAGIDVRFPESLVNVSHNVLSGRIRSRNDGEAKVGENLIERRRFLTDAEPLDQLFQAPSLGNFRWQGAPTIPMQQSAIDSHQDFCEQVVDTRYFGAFANRFCFDKVNLKREWN